MNKAQTRRQQILRALDKAAGPVRKQDLVAATGLSNGYLSDLLAAMLQTGVVAVGPQGYTRGRADQ